MTNIFLKGYVLVIDISQFQVALILQNPFLIYATDFAAIILQYVLQDQGLGRSA